MYWQRIVWSYSLYKNQPLIKSYSPLTRKVKNLFNLKLYLKKISFMKTTFTFICFLFILKTNLIAQFGQCSVNQSVSYMGNGVVQVNASGSVPNGMLPVLGVQCTDWHYSNGEFTDTVGTFTHTYSSNGAYIISSYMYAFDPNDSSGFEYCSATIYDTLIINDLPCNIDLGPINYYNSDSMYQIQCFPYPISPGSSSMLSMNWEIQDTLGNLIYTASGQDLTSIYYTFHQNSRYIVRCIAHINDTLGNTTCSDIATTYINYYPVVSCGTPIGLQQQNLQGNSVKLTANYTGTFSTRYFIIEGNYFWNTDTITYTFSTGGFHQVGFYGENNINGTICRNSITPGIPVGGMPGNCNAAFTLWEDSTNVGQWYAINNSTGFGPPNYLWDFGDGNTSNLAYPTHTYAVPGNYVICLTVSDNYGCSSTMCDSTSGMRISQQQAINSQMGSLTVLAPQVGISENKITIDGMKLFPNPMLDLATVEFNSTLSLNAKIEIVNILGSIVSTEDVFISNGNNELKLNTSSLESGIYIINVISDSGVIARVKALK